MIFALLIALVAIGVELWMIAQHLDDMKGAVGIIAAMIADTMAEAGGYRNRDEYMRALMKKVKQMEQEREQGQKL